MKILISSIGAGIRTNPSVSGSYQKTRYKIEDSIYEDAFIAKALVDHYQVEKVFLIGTKGSIWDGVYTAFGGDDDFAVKLYEEQENRTITDHLLKKVAKQIDTYLTKEGSKCFLINYGIEDDELWSNFELFLKMADSIDKGDEIFLDITHSFRSLAFMSFVMLEFLNLIKRKNISVQGVFYGMYEYIKEYPEVGYAPVVNLKIFYDLLQWIKAINEFNNYGSSGLISKLLLNNYKEEKEIFNNFTNSIYIGDMNNIRKSISLLNSKLEILKKSNHPIIKLLTSELEKFILMLNKHSIAQFQFELSKWFCDHGNFALSYICLVESLVSIECEKNGFKVTDFGKREEIKNNLRDSYKEFREINKIRNDIAHLNYTKKTIDSNEKIAKLRKYINWANMIFFIE